MTLEEYKQMKDLEDKCLDLQLENDLLKQRLKVLNERLASVDKIKEEIEIFIKAPKVPVFTIVERDFDSRLFTAKIEFLDDTRRSCKIISTGEEFSNQYELSVAGYSFKEDISDEIFPWE